MCNCITSLEERIVKKQPFDRLKVTKAQVTSSAFLLDGTTQMTGEIEIHCEGKKRPIKKMVAYSHCPICGKSYK